MVEKIEKESTADKISLLAASSQITQIEDRERMEKRRVSSGPDIQVTLAPTLGQQ